MAKHLKRAESRKSHSWWWDSHISPKNSKWLAENLEQMDESVKRMLKLIEEDGDSFAKKAEMYYQKRPQLILLVEDFYRMYRSLAERYDNLTGELRKNISSDLQSKTSSISEAASELTSLAFAGGSSDVYQNEADDSSSLTDSGTSESDSDKDADDLIAKVAAYEANEKLQLSQDEITRLRLKVQKYKSLEGAVYESTIKIQEAGVALPIHQEPGVHDHDSVDILEQLSDQSVAVFESAQKNDTTWESKLNSEGLEICKLQERIDSLLAVLSGRACKIRELEIAVSDAERKALVEKAKFEAEITNLLEEQSLLKGQLREYMSSSESLTASIRMEKTDCETSLNCKIEQLKEEIDTRDARILTLERSLEALKFDGDRLLKEIDAARVELSTRDEQMDGHLHQLHLEHAILTANAEEARKLVAELKSARKELEEEVERKKRVIAECWEEKREAIRQLCFSLEHYRSGYHGIRQAVGVRKRLAI